MSLLPANEPKILHTLDEALASRWGFDIIKNSLHPRWCDAKYLPFVAMAYDMDISNLYEASAREVLETAIYNRSKIGTVEAVKIVLKSFDANAEVITVATAPRHNSQHHYDGAIRHKDYPLDHWAKYTVTLSTPISISDKERLIAKLNSIAPARCELVGIEAQLTIKYDGSVRYNANYNYGGYING